VVERRQLREGFLQLIVFQMISILTEKQNEKLNYKQKVKRKTIQKKERINLIINKK
jgi:Spy/CpxP family protein refolding chaperone